MGMAPIAIMPMLKHLLHRTGPLGLQVFGDPMWQVTKQRSKEVFNSYSHQEMETLAS
jgi:hypothetical protein